MSERTKRRVMATVPKRPSTFRETVVRDRVSAYAMAIYNAGKTSALMRRFSFVDDGPCGTGEKYEGTMIDEWEPAP